MIVPQLTGDIRDWAQRLVASLTHELPQDLAHTAPPPGSIMLYEGVIPPEGWEVHVVTDLAAPAGYLWIRRGV